ncbi:MAG: glycosyltransferase family 9 protein [Ktedonobacteraceae bacterium]
MIEHALQQSVSRERTRLASMQPRKIAVLRALQLGDLLLAVPALRAIRAEFPYAEITLIGLPWAASFVRRFARYVDRFVEFTGYPGIAEVPVNPERSQQFLVEQRAYAYDLVIQMHGSGRISDQLALALGGKVTAGYYEQTPPARLTLGLPYPDDQPEVLRNLGLAKLLGCHYLAPTLEFPLFDEDYAEAAQLLGQLQEKVLVDDIDRVPPAHPGEAGVAMNNTPRPLIGIHTGARPSSRRWPAEYFAQVADFCARRFNAHIVLTGGADERSTVHEVIKRMSVEPLNVAGKTSLGVLAALISELDLFISNDTGPAHIANALQTPSVTIFGPVDPRRWAALDQTFHPIVRHPVACSPCSYWQCPIDHRCLRWVRPEMVMHAVEHVMNCASPRGTMTCSV